MVTDGCTMVKSPDARRILVSLFANFLASLLTRATLNLKIHTLAILQTSQAQMGHSGVNA
jgi:hypothetical protein